MLKVFQLRYFFLVLELRVADTSYFVNLLCYLLISPFFIAFYIRVVFPGDDFFLSLQPILPQQEVSF